MADQSQGQEQQKLIALSEKYSSLIWQLQSELKGLSLTDRDFVLASLAVQSFGTGQGAQENAQQFDKMVQDIMKMKGTG